MDDTDVVGRAAALARAGRAAEAVALVRAQAAEGNADACFAMANWHVYGLYGCASRSDAERLLTTASAAGHAGARELLATLIAQGRFPPSGWPQAVAMLASATATPRMQAWRALLAAMGPFETDAPTPMPAEVEPIADSPRIAIARGFLMPAECEHLRKTADAHLRQAQVIDPVTQRPALHPVRRCDAMNFAPTMEDPVIHALRLRMAAWTQVSVAQLEPLAVLRYGPGNEFRPHHDSSAGDPNPRILTVLTYLSDAYEGGETAFVETGLKVRGAVGDALLFESLDQDGRPHPLARHAGMPVTAGTKWLASCWIRQRAV